MKKYLSPLLIWGVVWAGFFLGGAPIAQAGILITPTRVVFEGRDRFGVVTLANNGDTVSTYKMEWRFFRMEEEGPAYVRVTKDDVALDLSKHIVFSPRQVTLEPGASQKIRLALRRSDEIPDGDYHAHLSFSTVSDDDLDVVPNNALKEKPTAGLSVKINVGYTIPIVLRSGDVHVDSSIGRISLSRNSNNGLLKVSVPVERGGSPYSILGHLIVYHVDGDGNEELVGEIGNAHIFSEIDRRVFDVQLTKDIVGGSLRIVMYDYKYNKSAGGNSIYVEKTFPLE